MNILASIMGYIIYAFCTVFANNYTLAIFMFTLLVNLIFLPLTINQQKTSAMQMRIRFKTEKLKQKYANDPRKFQQESAALQQQSGAKPLLGCLPLLIRIPFFMGIYYAVYQPLTHVLKVDSKIIEAAAKAFNIKTSTRGYETTILNKILSGDGASFKGLDTLKSAASKVSFNFLGIDLTQTPKFSWDFSKAELIWLIPLLSFATAMLSSIISMIMQKKNNPDAPQMKGMLLFMPLFSLWIAFSVPGAVGIYWACSNLVSTLMQVVAQTFFKPIDILANTEAKEIKKRREYEQARIAAAANAENAAQPTD